MLKTKFEAKSKRVKGLSFHKYRPWILASLHNGSINLFDYRAAVLLEKFEDHDGPVRGVNFHETQPLFVSGGDDHKVKVWNYKTKKCLFTLTGHLDYIRTVEFHKELPWICSSSDDQTIRIWNWQNRSVIAILTGHSHYVMSATFHPEETLLASASLDQTIRIWDFSRLKEKSMQKQGSRPNEIFGGTEVEVKHIIEGHEKGVNWVSFHPTMKIVASGADDKCIKLWRLSGNKHWEMDTLKGHANNVSCVLFHPRMEILISNSEDKTLRIWDLNRRVQIHQTRKDTDRFWILAAHPSLNYFAAGYDNGMMVYKLERENYASARYGSYIFFVKNKNLYFHDLTSKEKTIMAPVNTNGKQVLLNQPKSVYYNQFNNSSHDVILNFDVEGGCFIIYEFHKDLKQIRCVSEKRGDYTQAAVFLSKDKICVLDQNKELAVCNFDGGNMKKFQVNKKGSGKIEMIYPGPLGKVLIFADDSLMLYDISARKVMHEVPCSDVKAVYWNTNANTPFTHAAIITKTQIIMVNKNLDIIHSQKENAKIKSGCFDETNAFIYSTSTHIKYMFCDGKTTGTFKSIDEPVYVSFYMKNNVYAFNRLGDLLTLEVNNTDYLFKLALQQKNLNEVKEILSQGNLCGHSIVSYLKEQGHSEIALFFESDLKQRFNLAIASGNIQVAFDAAKELKEKDNFIKLAQTALLLGNYDITEKCYQIIRSMDKLNFFYATTGSMTKLKKMQQVAQSLNDHTLRFNSSIYTGDIVERVKVLAETGQIPLAYLMAKSHGLTEIEKTLEESIRSMEGVDPEAIFKQADTYSRRSKALLPLRPLYVGNETYQQREWPMKNLRAMEAERAAQMFQNKRQPELAESDEMFFDAKEFHTSNKQVANILSATGPAHGQSEAQTTKTTSQVLNVENANWGDDDLDIDADNMLEDTDVATDQQNADISANAEQNEDSDIFVPPSQGADPLHLVVKKNPLIAGLHVAIGDYQKALELLKKQIAVSNFEPLKQIFVDVSTMNKMKIQTLPHIGSMEIKLKGHNGIPTVVVNLNNIKAKYNKGIDLTTKGEFGQALDTFRQCLQGCSVTVVTSQKEKQELAELIRKIGEYVTAMRIELERKRISGSDNLRGTELSCYMTLCAMDDGHKFLAYKNAMNNNYKMQNFITAANFARLVLELEPTGMFANKPEIIPQFKKYFQAFQQKGTNAQKLNYDHALNVEVKEVNGYLCTGSLTPLEDSRSVNTVKCPLDNTIYQKSWSGKVCETCQLCLLGQDAIGLTNYIEAGGHLE